MTEARPSARRGVLAGGGWLVDHVKMIDAWPQQDALVLISDTSYANGGCPFNVLKALAKLECGFPLSGAGLIGDDMDGEWIMADCAECGIDTRALRKTTAAMTSYTDVMTVASTGRRTFFHSTGTNDLLSVKDFDLAASNAAIFHLGYLALLEVLDAVDGEGRTGASRLFEQARGLGMITSGDLVSKTSGEFASAVDPSLPYLDYLFLNEFEAARLLGETPSESVVSPAWLTEAARRTLNRGVRRAVIIHTPQGAVCALAEGGVVTQGIVRVPPAKIRGTAGAGDAFCAGCLMGIHEGRGMQECLELGVCAAASSLYDATCSAGIMPWKECFDEGRMLGFTNF